MTSIHNQNYASSDNQLLSKQYIAIQSPAMNNLKTIPRTSLAEQAVFISQIASDSLLVLILHLCDSLNCFARNNYAFKNPSYYMQSRTRPRTIPILRYQFNSLNMIRNVPVFKTKYAI